MKIEKMNYIFSIAFIIWSLCYTTAFWLDGLKEIEFFVICGFIIATVFFNILAYKLNRCYFYLLGVSGFLVFTILHFCAIFVIINGIIWHKRFNVFLPVAIFGFPLGIFGLFSTLFCFQQKYNEQFDQNYRNISKPKCVQILLKFCVKDFVKCIILFNVAIIVFFGILACQYRYHQGSDFVIALFNLPIIFPVIILLAILFKSKKLCYGGFFGYGLFIGIAIGFFFFGIYQTYNTASNHGSRIMNLFVLSLIFCTGFIYSFIGINTTLFLYRKYGNQNEVEIKRAPNVIYKTSFYLSQSSKSFMP